MIKPDLTLGNTAVTKSSVGTNLVFISLDDRLCMIEGEIRLNSNDEIEFKGKNEDEWSVRPVGSCVSDVERIRREIIPNYIETLRQEIQRVEKMMIQKTPNKNTYY